MSSTAIRARSIASVALIALLLALYTVAIFGRAFALIATGQLAAVLIGIFVLTIPLIGIWALVAELRFGAAATRLSDALAAEGKDPTIGLPTRPSGRPEPQAAAALLDGLYDTASAEGATWQDVMAYALTQDAAGSRRAARRAIVQAIKLEREQRRGSQ